MATAPFSSILAFRMAFHNFLTTSKNDNHKGHSTQSSSKSGSRKYLPHTILPCQSFQHFTRPSRLHLLLFTEVPAKDPSRIPSLLCAVPSEGLGHLDQGYYNYDSALCPSYAVSQLTHLALLPVVCKTENGPTTHQP